MGYVSLVNYVNCNLQLYFYTDRSVYKSLLQETGTTEPVFFLKSVHYCLPNVYSSQVQLYFTHAAVNCNAIVRLATRVGHVNR